MHAFVDDSGDPGMKMDDGSTRYLVLAACIFRDTDHMDEAAAAILGCKRALGRGARWEFKHTKTSDDVKEEFFNVTRRLTYHVRAIVIDKHRIYSNALTSKPGYLQNYAIKELFTHTLGTIQNAKLVVDGKDSRAFRLKQASYFLRMVNAEAPGTLAKVTSDDSVRNPLIQLADMTAGAIRRHYEHPEKASKLHFAQINGRARAPWGGIWDYTAPR